MLLENAALGLRPRAAFSRPRSQFFAIRTSQPVNNIYIFQNIPKRNFVENKTAAQDGKVGLNTAKYTTAFLYGMVSNHFFFFVLYL